MSPPRISLELEETRKSVQHERHPALAAAAAVAAAASDAVLLLLLLKAIESLKHHLPDKILSYKECIHSSTFLHRAKTTAIIYEHLTYSGIKTNQYRTRGQQ